VFLEIDFEEIHASTIKNNLYILKYARLNTMPQTTQTQCTSVLSANLVGWAYLAA
jgi:hypothetical protein